MNTKGHAASDTCPQSSFHSTLLEFQALQKA
uniref:Uncharacterized protein n=1 Tax=Anguilla anguilla TaxID=7936 RepID=A0A0E9SG51_ANGAN